MWNNNNNNNHSRSWLVNTMVTTDPNTHMEPMTATTTTATIRTRSRHTNNCTCCSSDSPCSAKRMKKKLKENSDTSAMMRGADSASTTHALFARQRPATLGSGQQRSLAAQVKPCLNQIIEVLLAILLVNCLATALTGSPRAEAAFGAPFRRPGDRYEQATHGGHDDPLSFSPNFEYRSHGDHYNYRYPHNIVAAAPYYNGVLVAAPPQPATVAAADLEDYQSPNQLTQRSQNFKISPKPCSIGRIEGTCMFVWECIKSEGRHVGMCVDSFMFGSCCTHNYTENIVMPQPFAYTRPTKPLGMSGVNHRPRPPHLPHKPSISGMTTIERPHGAGTLVIRPSGPHHQGALHRPQHTKPTTTVSTSTSTIASTSTEDPHLSWTSNAVLNDLQSASSSSSSGIWNTVTSSATSPPSTALQQQQHSQHHWHMPTEPNFITKTRPPTWEKPTTSLPPSLYPKPTKPTKKPAIIHAERPQFHQQQQTPTRKPSTSTSTSTTMMTTTTRRPTTTTTTRRPTTTMRPRPYPQQPQFSQSKPTKTPAAGSTAPGPPQHMYTRPTPSWSGGENVASSKQPASSYPPTSSSPSSTAMTTTTKTTTTTTTTMMPTTQKYRPTTSSSTATAASTSTITHRPMAPTSRPTLSSTSSTQSLTSSTTAGAPTAASTATHSTTISQSLLSHNLTTIESNEITGSNSGPSPTSSIAGTIIGSGIKTITAARSECGVPVLARPETRIVGGKSAAFGRWPWQVSVRRTSFFGFSSTHRCGGALINENWIATAGHCVDDLLISQIRIRVGEYDFSHVQEQLPYIERAVAKKVVHPKYNFFTYEYDLALVKLEQPLEFAPHVSPICLPETESLLIGMNATVTGWGRLSEGGTLPSVLQEVSVPIVSNDNCKSMFLRAGRQEFIPEIFLCAGYEGGGHDSCQGDSGGPLQVKAPDGRFFLAGIISWGIGCAEANLPGVCTRISKFVPWIVENVT